MAYCALKCTTWKGKMFLGILIYIFIFSPVIEKIYGRRIDDHEEEVSEMIHLNQA